MGGDNAPEEPVKAAVEAVKEKENIQVILTGVQDVIEAELRKYPDYPKDRIRVVHASQVIETAEHLSTNHSSKLRTKTGEYFIFMNHQCLARFLDRFEYRLFIQRNQGANINDFHFPATFFFQSFCCVQTEMGGIAIGNNA